MFHGGINYKLREQWSRVEPHSCPTESFCKHNNTAIHSLLQLVFREERPGWHSTQGPEPCFLLENQSDVCKLTIKKAANNHKGSERVCVNLLYVGVLGGLARLLPVACCLTMFPPLWAVWNYK